MELGEGVKNAKGRMFHDRLETLTHVHCSRAAAALIRVTAFFNFWKSDLRTVQKLQPLEISARQSNVCERHRAVLRYAVTGYPFLTG